MHTLPTERKDITGKVSKSEVKAKVQSRVFLLSKSQGHKHVKII